MQKENIRWDIDEAWGAICDTFPTETQFTLRQAVEAAWPHIKPNNKPKAANKIRTLFETVAAPQGEIPAQVQKVRGEGLNEVWFLTKW